MQKRIKYRAVAFILSFLMACPWNVVGATRSLSDFSPDLSQSAERTGPRDPFAPGMVESGKDVSALTLDGVISGPGVRLALISGKIVREGDLHGPFLVKSISPFAVQVQSEEGIQSLSMENNPDGEVYSGDSYEIIFNNAALKQAVRMIGMAGKFNIAVPEATEGRVTLVFHQTPLRDALGSILRVNELDFAEENGIIRVGKPDVFPTGANFTTRTIPLNYARAATILPTIQAHISEKGTVTADDRTNSIILKDSPSILENVARIISSIDTTDTEIHIEAKIVDVKRNFSRSLGIQWGFTKTDGRVQGFGAGSVGDIGNGTPGNVNFPAVNPTSGFGILVGNVLNGANLDATVTAAESRGDAHIISQPSIATVNNTAAKIRSGLKIYVKTTSSISVGGSGGGASSEDSGLEEIDTGIELTVTPQMTGKDMLKLKIDAVESEADFSRTVDNIPAVIDNTASTTVLLRNGETTVIGGMMKVNKSNIQQGVPFISTIPLLGWLFKNKTKSKSDNELLIFITPRIIDRSVAKARDVTLDPVIPTVEVMETQVIDAKKSRSMDYKHRR